LSETQLRIFLGNEPAEIGRARLALLQFLAPAKLPDRQIYRLELVLEELLGNIIRYAFTEPSPSAIELAVTLVGGDVILTFEDSGKPFDPLDVPEPSRPTDISAAKVGGRGLSLVRKFADRLDYQRRDGRNRLEVRIAAASLQ
jgi:anti-sigma regulatory factor (Ser/Thr protein kinase)